MLLKYMCIYILELQLIAHDVTPGFVNFFFLFCIYWVPVGKCRCFFISAQSFFICVNGCLIYIGV